MKKQKVIHREKSKIWAGSILAALIAAVAVFVVMLQMEKRILTQYEKGTILTAAKEIPKGQIITSDDMAGYFEEKELDQSCIPASALTSLEKIKDMVAAADIDTGAMLTEGMFEELEEITAGMKEPVIAGFKAEDLYQVAGGVLRTGDRINIYGVNEEGEASLHWQNVFVQQVFDNAGVSIASEDAQSAAQRINVYLDKGDVEQFYSQLATGSLRVVKVCD